MCYNMFMGRKESLDKLINFLQAAIFALFAVIVSLIGWVVTHYETIALGLFIMCLVAAVTLTLLLFLALVLFFKKVKELEDL